MQHKFFFIVCLFSGFLAGLFYSRGKEDPLVTFFSDVRTFFLGSWNKLKSLWLFLVRFVRGRRDQKKKSERVQKMFKNLGWIPGAKKPSKKEGKKK